MPVGSSLRSWLPRFWRGEAGVAGDALGIALIPAELVFDVAVRGRSALYDRGLLKSESAAIPVISVGNVTVGGTGKTPVCAWLAKRLRQWGREPAIVLRGYGADEISVHRELNPSVPVLAAARRIEGVRAASAAGSDCVVLDDGFQHRAVARDLDIVLIAAEQWSVPRRLLPRGRWREPVQSLRRADFVLVTRKSAPAGEAASIAETLRAMFESISVGVAHITPTRLVPLRSEPGRGQNEFTLDHLTGRDVLAVTSIADPRPFADHLRSLGAATDMLAFPDHHEFTGPDISTIEAEAAGRAIVVTHKDAVKLRENELKGEVYVLEQEVVLEEGESALDDALRGAIRTAR